MRLVLDGNVLELPIRAQLYEAIRASPGVTKSELVARVGRHKSIVLHHTGVLERAGLIMSVVQPKVTHYYDRAHRTSEEDRREIEAGARSGTRGRIMEAVKRSGAAGVEARHIAPAVGVGVTSTHHHLKKLINAGLVARERKKNDRGRWADIFRIRSSVEPQSGNLMASGEPSKQDARP